MKISDTFLSVIAIVVIAAFTAGLAYGGVSLLRMDNDVDGPPHFEEPFVINNHVLVFQRDSSIFLEYLGKEYDFNENIATIRIEEKTYPDKKIKETIVKYIVFDDDTGDLLYKEMTTKYSLTRTAKFWRRVGIILRDVAGVILLIIALFLCSGMIVFIYLEATNPFVERKLRRKLDKERNQIRSD